MQEACAALRALCARHLEEALGAQLVPALAALLADEASLPPVRQEACAALAAAAEVGTAEQRVRMVSQGGLPALCALVHTADPELAAPAIGALERLLLAADLLRGQAVPGKRAEGKGPRWRADGSGGEERLRAQVHAAIGTDLQVKAEARLSRGKGAGRPVGASARRHERLPPP